MMQKLPILFFLFLSYTLQSQEVKCTRQANLVKGGYTISGQAFLEELTDGSLRLRLSSSFTTPSGPDVQIFLSNDSVSIASALMIADIGTEDGLNHFSGALNLNVPSGHDINQYQFIVFRCVAFNLHWAGGRFMESSCGGGNPVVCPSSTIGLTFNDINIVRICANDGLPDTVLLYNSTGKAPGSEYVYVVTNEARRVRRILTTAFNDFEGTGTEIELIFGLAIQGNLSWNPGDLIDDLTAGNCVKLSDNLITVSKDECTPAFQCLGTGTATTNWIGKVDICPADGIPDKIPLKNSAFQDAGEHYAYIVTDSARRIQTVITKDTFDFEGSGPNEQRVYGVSYDGNLQYSSGMDVYSLTASACAVVSDSVLFLRITKNACLPIDTMEVDTTVFGTISGTVVNIKGESMPQVSVILNDSIKRVTDALGKYEFINVPVGPIHRIKALKNVDHLNGVSTSDIVTCQRHILQLKEFDQTYQYVAGDVNLDERISSIDLVLLRRLILGLDTEYKASNSWRFTSISALQGTSSKVQEIFDIEISLLTKHAKQDFIGIKIGDVNGNASPN